MICISCRIFASLNRRRALNEEYSLSLIPLEFCNSKIWKIYNAKVKAT